MGFFFHLQKIYSLVLFYYLPKTSLKQCTNVKTIKLVFKEILAICFLNDA